MPAIGSDSDRLLGLLPAVTVRVSVLSTTTPVPDVEEEMLNGLVVPLPTMASVAEGATVLMPTFPPAVAKYVEPVDVKAVAEAFASVVFPETTRVPVAVKLAPVRLPEKNPLPATSSLFDGDVVAMPTLPAALIII